MSVCHVNVQQHVLSSTRWLAYQPTHRFCFSSHNATGMLQHLDQIMQAASWRTSVALRRYLTIGPFISLEAQQPGEHIVLRTPLTRMSKKSACAVSARSSSSALMLLTAVSSGVGVGLPDLGCRRRGAGELGVIGLAAEPIRGAREPLGRGAEGSRPRLSGLGVGSVPLMMTLDGRASTVRSGVGKGRDLLPAGYLDAGDMPSRDQRAA